MACTESWPSVTPATLSSGDVTPRSFAIAMTFETPMLWPSGTYTVFSDAAVAVARSVYRKLGSPSSLWTT